MNGESGSDDRLNGFDIGTQTVKVGQMGIKRSGWFNWAHCHRDVGHGEAVCATGADVSLEECLDVSRLQSNVQCHHSPGLKPRRP